MYCRPVFVTGPSISPNLAGRMASSFAICYTLLKETDPQTASNCLSYGQAIFAAANVSMGDILYWRSMFLL
jgi:hypothetical protein